jgi:hypothetical protein
MRVRFLSFSALQLVSLTLASSDEFAEVKAVKLLRRGRRLQQVECALVLPLSFSLPLFTLSEQGRLWQIHRRGGRSFCPSVLVAWAHPQTQTGILLLCFLPSLPHPASVRSTARLLTPSRLPSLLYADPIIDPSEFCARFFEFSKGNCNALGVPGQLIAMLLAVWAASFGVNEYGIEELHHGEGVIRNRREATNEMVREMLHLIDIHGILRKPTWDGVRALHLLLPLTQGSWVVFSPPNV